MQNVAVGEAIKLFSPFPILGRGPRRLNTEMHIRGENKQYSNYEYKNGKSGKLGEPIAIKELRAPTFPT